MKLGKKMVGLRGKMKQGFGIEGEKGWRKEEKQK